eukprot:132524_1
MNVFNNIYQELSQHRLPNGISSNDALTKPGGPCVKLPHVLLKMWPYKSNTNNQMGKRTIIYQLALELMATDGTKADILDEINIRKELIDKAFDIDATNVPDHIKRQRKDNLELEIKQRMVVLGIAIIRADG